MLSEKKLNGGGKEKRREEKRQKKQKRSRGRGKVNKRIGREYAVFTGTGQDRNRAKEGGIDDRVEECRGGEEEKRSNGVK